MSADVHTPRAQYDLDQVVLYHDGKCQHIVLNGTDYRTVQVQPWDEDEYVYFDVVYEDDPDTSFRHRCLRENVSTTLYVENV